MSVRQVFYRERTFTNPRGEPTFKHVETVITRETFLRDLLRAGFKPLEARRRARESGYPAFKQMAAEYAAGCSRPPSSRIY